MQPAARNLALACFLISAVHADDLARQSKHRDRSEIPPGVYAHVDIQAAITRYPGSATPTPTQLHTYLRKLYASLFANPAITGMTAGVHWDTLQPSASTFDWSYLDDVFAEANLTRKAIQLILTPGFDSPPWLLAQLSSCDSLFTAGSAPPDCGKVTFVDFPESQRADSNVLPLPWNSVYEGAWQSFLAQLNARYAANPAFVSIAIAGPMGGSTEMIFPTSQNTTAPQPSGLSVDATWAALIAHSFPSTPGYLNTDQVFIDQWDRTIDAYEKIFSGITIFLSPDAGNDFPALANKVTPHPDNTLVAIDCSNNSMSCEAKTEILSYFATVAGPNTKGTQVGGMTASSPYLPGDIGVAGIKVFAALSPSFLAGAEFDFAVSSPATIQAEGCLPSSPTCTLTPEAAAYNVLTAFFYGTPVAAFYGAAVGTARLNYLELDYTDIQYAQANPCPAASSPIIGKMSLQDLLNRASHDLIEIADLREPRVPLPPSTCQH